MNLKEIIYKRQSCRSYNDEALNEETLNSIKEFITKTKKLNPNIKWAYDIVSSDQIKTILPWKAPHYLLLFSQNKENYRQNIGFIFQQVDLYLQSIGIGSCWLGMVSPNSSYKNKYENYEYVIGISFGYPSGKLYRKTEDFKRKQIKDIADNFDEKLKPARYAPSARNSQPWYFTHNPDGTYNIYTTKFGILKGRFFGRWSKIDIGICLAHLYIENQDTFEFNISENPPKLKGFIYEGTFKI